MKKGKKSVESKSEDKTEKKKAALTDLFSSIKNLKGQKGVSISTDKLEAEVRTSKKSRKQKK